MKKIIKFRKVTQAAIFACEIQGQLSDGNWENARPFDHWKPWCSAEVQIAPDDADVGRNFFPHKENYSLVALFEFDEVVWRMRMYGALAELYPECVRAFLEAGHCSLPYGLQYWNKFEEWAQSGDHPWAESTVQSWLDAGLTKSRVYRAERLIDKLFSKSDLRRTLRGIKAQMKTMLPKEDW